jgi:hypothetical protein
VAQVSALRISSAWYRHIPIVPALGIVPKLRKLSPQAATACDALGSDFSYKMTYQGNVLKVWYTPRDFIRAGLNIPLAEKPTPKDKWFNGKVTVLTYPPMPDDLSVHFARILLGGTQQERYDDPEVQGGRIALIASDHNKVQRPSSSLDHMHASLPKQVAYNQRVLSAEDQIAGINSEVGDFLSKMSVQPTDSIIICVNAGESLKSHEEHMGGQLWIRSDRQMTAMNIPFPGRSNDSESACLAGVAEAVEWAHVLEDGLPKRTTQRIVIYPPTLPEFSRVLSGGSSNLGEGHEIAYQPISAACTLFESPPAFYSADSQSFGGLDIVEKVPLWMHTAAQVSIGGRKQILEDGADVCNSESHSENEDFGEELTGMYTSDVPLDAKGCPVDGRHKLSEAQANALRAQANALRPPRKASVEREVGFDR